MKNRFFTFAVALVLVACGINPSGPEQRGYNITFGDMVLAGGPFSDNQSLRESSDIDVCACTNFATGLCSVVEYEATIGIVIQVHEGRDFAQGLEVRLTDYVLTFQALESISDSQQIFVNFPSKTVNYGSKEGPVIYVGTNNSVEQDVVFNFLGGDDLIRYRIDIENALGTTIPTQLENTVLSAPEGMYAFPMHRWRLVMYFEDNYGSKTSEVVQGTIEVGDFDSNDEACD